MLQRSQARTTRSMSFSDQWAPCCSNSWFFNKSHWESENQRIREGTCQDRVVKILALHRTLQESHHGSESIVEALFELRLGAVTTSLGTLFQFWVKNFSLMSNLNLHQLSYMSFTQILSLVTTVKVSVPAPLLSLTRNLQTAGRSPRSLLFYRLDRPNYLSHSSYGFPSRPFDILAGLHWILSNGFVSFIYWGT